LPALPSGPPGINRRRRKRRDEDSSTVQKEDDLLAIKLMRTGAKKSPSYRVVVKEKTPNAMARIWRILEPTIQRETLREIKLKLSRVNYWIEKVRSPLTQLAG
jgi:ribosomal protein S16